MIPTLNESTSPQDVKAMLSYYSLVASGQIPPILQEFNAILAAQAMCILLTHIKDKP